MPIFGFLPGADKDSIARREIADLDPTRTRSADRTGAWNWQDSFGAWMAGTNKEEILKLAQEKADEDLRLQLEPSATAAAANLGNLTPSYQGVTGKTQEQLVQEIQQDVKRGETLQNTIASSPTLDVTTLSPTASAGAIQQAGSKANKKETERKEQEARTRTQKETERLEGRQDTLLERTELREDRRDARARLDRLEDRRMQAQNRQMNMQLEYARMAQQDRYRAQDKKDKAMMMLLQGLGNLGAAFTI